MVGLKFLAAASKAPTAPSGTAQERASSSEAGGGPASSATATALSAQQRQQGSVVPQEAKLSDHVQVGAGVGSGLGGEPGWAGAGWSGSRGLDGWGRPRFVIAIIFLFCVGLSFKSTGPLSFPLHPLPHPPLQEWTNDLMKAAGDAISKKWGQRWKDLTGTLQKPVPEPTGKAPAGGGGQHHRASLEQELTTVRTSPPRASTTTTTPANVLHTTTTTVHTSSYHPGGGDGAAADMAVAAAAAAELEAALAGANSPPTSFTKNPPSVAAAASSSQAMPQVTASGSRVLDASDHLGSVSAPSTSVAAAAAARQHPAVARVGGQQHRANKGSVDFDVLMNVLETNGFSYTDKGIFSYFWCKVGPPGGTFLLDSLSGSGHPPCQQATAPLHLFQGAAPARGL